MVISVDPEFNNYVFAEEGRTVELYYMDTFSNIFKHEGESRTNAHGSLHKYIRGIFLTHFGAQSLKNKLIPLIEQFVDTNLRAWSNQSSIEVKHEASAVKFQKKRKRIFCLFLFIYYYFHFVSLVKNSVAFCLLSLLLF